MGLSNCIGFLCYRMMKSLLLLSLLLNFSSLEILNGPSYVYIFIYIMYYVTLLCIYSIQIQINGDSQIPQKVYGNFF